MKTTEGRLDWLKEQQTRLERQQDKLRHSWAKSFNQLAEKTEKQDTELGAQLVALNERLEVACRDAQGAWERLEMLGLETSPGADLRTNGTSPRSSEPREGGRRVCEQCGGSFWVQAYGGDWKCSVCGFAVAFDDIGKAGGDAEGRRRSSSPDVTQPLVAEERRRWESEEATAQSVSYLEEQLAKTEAQAKAAFVAARKADQRAEAERTLRLTESNRLREQLDAATSPRMASGWAARRMTSAEERTTEEENADLRKQLEQSRDIQWCDRLRRRADLLRQQAEEAETQATASRIAAREAENRIQALQLNLNESLQREQTARQDVATAYQTIRILEEKLRETDAESRALQEQLSTHERLTWRVEQLEKRVANLREERHDQPA